jgi:hypothetical protein
MDSVSIAAVGDISTGHEPPESAFVHVKETLAGADLRFAQCERVYSERGTTAHPLRRATEAPRLQCMLNWNVRRRPG